MKFKTQNPIVRYLINNLKVIKLKCEPIKRLEGQVIVKCSAFEKGVPLGPLSKKYNETLHCYEENVDENGYNFFIKPLYKVDGMWDVRKTLKESLKEVRYRICEEMTNHTRLIDNYNLRLITLKNQLIDIDAASKPKKSSKKKKAQKVK
jgi:hypothetical protein